MAWDSRIEKILETKGRYINLMFYDPSLSILIVSSVPEEATMSHGAIDVGYSYSSDAPGAIFVLLAICVVQSLVYAAIVANRN